MRQTKDQLIAALTQLLGEKIKVKNTHFTKDEQGDFRLTDIEGDLVTIQHESGKKSHHLVDAVSVN